MGLSGLQKERPGNEKSLGLDSYFKRYVGYYNFSGHKDYSVRVSYFGDNLSILDGSGERIMFGFKQRKILRKAISLTYPFAATHNFPARDHKGRPVLPNHPNARSFCIVGYIERATHLCGYEQYPYAEMVVERVQDKNKLESFLPIYFDSMHGTAADARKMLEKAL